MHRIRRRRGVPSHVKARGLESRKMPEETKGDDKKDFSVSHYETIVQIENILLNNKGTFRRVQSGLDKSRPQTSVALEARKTK